MGFESLINEEIKKISDSEVVIERGTELFHGTVEEFNISDIRTGGYDNILWTTTEPAIAQTYIPTSPGKIYTSSSLLANPMYDEYYRPIQRQLGINYDYNQVKFENRRATSYPPAPEFDEYYNEHYGSLRELSQKDRELRELIADLTNKINNREISKEEIAEKRNEIDRVQDEVKVLEKRYHESNLDRKKHEFVNSKLIQLGYKPDMLDNYNLNHSWKVKIEDGKILPADQRTMGRLLIIKPKRDLRIYDATMGGSIEGDLTNLEYHKHDWFIIAQESGYDGIKINDFAQSEDLGNFGHISYGLFGDTIKDLDVNEIPAQHRDLDQMYKKGDYSTPEYEKFKSLVNEEIENMFEDFTKFTKENIKDELRNYVFRDENIGYHHNQYDNRLLMYDKDDNLLGKIYYTIFNDVVSINFVESKVKGKGYGKIAMIYLAEKYGYENLERTALTDDGVKMRKTLDDFFDFDYVEHKKSKSKHINPAIIDEIKTNHPIVADFMRDMVKYGYEETWNKWMDYLRKNDLFKKYDFNDISEITTWIEDSVTNDNRIEDEPPEYIYADLNKLIDVSTKIKNIVNEELIDFLNETAASDIQEKFYSDIPKETFYEIIKADPTSKIEKDKMGKFSKWLLMLFQRNKLRLEDLYKATEYLKKFVLLNKYLPEKDILKYRSLPQLYAELKKLDSRKQIDVLDTKGNELINSDEVDLFYNDDKWVVIIPRTLKASCYFGSDAWCTTKPNFFEDYTSKSDLYIFIDKTSPQDRYQLHLHDGQFMDINDEEANITEIIPENIFKMILEKEGHKYETIDIETSTNYEKHMELIDDYYCDKNDIPKETVLDVLEGTFFVDLYDVNFEETLRYFIGDIREKINNTLSERNIRVESEVYDDKRIEDLDDFEFVAYLEDKHNDIYENLIKICRFALEGTYYDKFYNAIVDGIKSFDYDDYKHNVIRFGIPIPDNDDCIEVEEPHYGFDYSPDTKTFMDYFNDYYEF